jgi:hypothetical protein
LVYDVHDENKENRAKHHEKAEGEEEMNFELSDIIRNYLFIYYLSVHRFPDNSSCILYLARVGSQAYIYDIVSRYSRSRCFQGWR